MAFDLGNNYRITPCEIALRMKIALNPTRTANPEAKAMELFRGHSNKLLIVEIIVSLDELNLFHKFIEEMDDFDLRYTDDKLLKIAVYHACYDCTRYFLEQGCNVACENDYPIRAAADYNVHSIRMLELLVDYGADIQANNNHAICLAADNGQIETVKFLIEHGADVNTQNCLPLIYAIRCGAPNIVDLLIDSGANPNNRKIIMTAIETYDPEMLSLIINRGANVHNLLKKDIVKIIQLGSLEIIRILADADLDFTIVNDYKADRMDHRGLQSMLIHLNIEISALVGIMYDKPNDPCK